MEQSLSTKSLFAKFATCFFIIVFFCVCNFNLIAHSISSCFKKLYYDRTYLFLEEETDTEFYDDNDYPYLQNSLFLSDLDVLNAYLDRYQINILNSIELSYTLSRASPEIILSNYPAVIFLTTSS